MFYGGHDEGQRCIVTATDAQSISGVVVLWRFGLGEAGFSGKAALTIASQAWPGLCSSRAGRSTRVFRLSPRRSLKRGSRRDTVTSTRATASPIRNRRGAISKSCSSGLSATEAYADFAEMLLNSSPARRSVLGAAASAQSLRRQGDEHLLRRGPPRQQQALVTGHKQTWLARPRLDCGGDNVIARLAVAGHGFVELGHPRPVFLIGLILVSDSPSP